MRTCGECTYCCKVVEVTELNKPSGVWCENCDIGRGCKIYADRPDGCQGFVCFWLQKGNFPTELGAYGMPDEMRPDKVKAVFGGNQGDTRAVVYIDPSTPDHWRTNRLVNEYIERLRRWYSVIIVCGNDGRKLLPAYNAQGQRDVETLVQLGASLARPPT